MGLRGRMAASYVLVTAAAVVVVEAVILGVYVPTLIGASDLQNRLQTRAGRDAKVLSLTVSDVNAANPGAVMTDKLIVAQKMARDDISLNGTRAGQDQGVPIPYTMGEALDQPVEALVDIDGVVLAAAGICAVVFT
ncbi:hypothetical protein ABZU75_06910 [Streptosporangium sp. NPDC005286]|uniref:hypothetical protein n=1 Tax=Streptosporangium sp. NPDC005286 TaxID=3154463 RepID=UPI0033A65F2A